MTELFLVIAGWLYELADALAAFAVFLFIFLVYAAIMILVFWAISAGG